jgi:OFA family oxalate/formate antiporter-like MFS transporter
VQRRYLILVAAVIMQMCLGATYSWSVFVAPIRAWWKLPQSLTQLPFTFFYIVFPLMTLAGGQLMTRWPVRWCAVLGGVLFASGYMIASLGAVHYAFTVFGIGILAAAGVGFAYLVPLQTCILWFPRQKALVSGLAVAGFGGGAAAVATVATRLMSHSGFSPFEVFRVVGAVAMVLVPLSGWTMVKPVMSSAPGDPGTQAIITTPLSRVVRHSAFWILYAAMMVGLMAGFAVNANLRELAPGKAMELGAAAVSLFALGNAAGRITWGAVFDRLPGTSTVAANLLAQAALLVTMALLLRGSPAHLPWYALAAGFNYGGVLVLYAVSIAVLWGAENVGRIYGALFTSNAPAALAPLLAGYIYDRTGSFVPALFTLAALLAAGAISLKLSLRRLALK